MDKETIDLVIQELNKVKSGDPGSSKFTRYQIESFIRESKKNIYEIVSDAISSEMMVYTASIESYVIAENPKIEVNSGHQSNQEIQSVNLIDSKYLPEDRDNNGRCADVAVEPDANVSNNIEDKSLDDKSASVSNSEENKIVQLDNIQNNDENIVPNNNSSSNKSDKKYNTRKFVLKGSKLQAGVEYNGFIESADKVLGVMPVIKSVEIIPDVGLKPDAIDICKITGTPTAGGDINIVVHYAFDENDDTPVKLSYTFTEYVNHDPKTLWKNIPSNSDDLNWKADSESVLITTKSNNIVAASQRGRSHAHEGKFRDDDFKIEVADSGWIIIAVADGAGSASVSRRGSQLAVSTSVSVLNELLSSDEGRALEKYISDWCKNEASTENVIAKAVYPLLGVAAFKACHAIENEAMTSGIQVKEYSTTLLVTVYKKLEVGHAFATYWVGDGGVGIYSEDGPPVLLGKVDSGDFAGQTRFLDRKVMTTEEISSRLQFHVCDKFSALIAMTDGITDPWFMTDNNLESSEYWDKLWTELQPSFYSEFPNTSLLNWLDFWSPGNHDDRTIVVLR